jgi:hypothetical protein
VFAGLYASGQLISIAPLSTEDTSGRAVLALGYPARLRLNLCDIYPRRFHEFR